MSEFDPSLSPDERNKIPSLHSAPTLVIVYSSQVECDSLACVRSAATLRFTSGASDGQGCWAVGTRALWVTDLVYEVSFEHRAGSWPYLTVRKNGHWRHFDGDWRSERRRRLDVMKC